MVVMVLMVMAAMVVTAAMVLTAILRSSFCFFPPPYSSYSSF